MGTAGYKWVEIKAGYKNSFPSQRRNQKDPKTKATYKVLEFGTVLTTNYTNQEEKQPTRGQMSRFLKSANKKRVIRIVFWAGDFTFIFPQIEWFGYNPLYAGGMGGHL